MEGSIVRRIYSFIMTIVIVFSVLSCNVSAAISPDVYNSQEVLNILQKTDVFKLDSSAAILIDADSGKILLEKDIHKQLPIASVTKVMSMLLIMDAIDSGKIKYEDMVKVTEYAASMGGSQAYLKPGEEFTVKDMLKAIAVHSSNDVTVAMAEHISGGESTFVADMNEMAKKLGMKDTHFLDCTGLIDEGHYSSAYDIALMSREIIVKHPKILEFTSIWHDTFRNGQFDLDNTNRMINSYNGMDGLKTGYTEKAGYCLAATAKRNDLRLISVVLGASDTNQRFAQTRKLLDYGFANFQIVTVAKKNDELGIAKVKKGVQTSLAGVATGDVKLCLKREEKDKFVKEFKPDNNLVAPIKKGQQIGQVIYKVGNDVVAKYDVVAKDDVKKASFIRLLFRMIGELFSRGK